MADPGLARAGATGLGASRSDRITRTDGSRIWLRLWCSQVVSLLGDWVGLIAVTAIAVRVGGGNSGAAVHSARVPRLTLGLARVPRLTVGLVGLPRLTPWLVGVLRLSVGLVGLRRLSVGLVGLRRLSVGLRRLSVGLVGLVIFGAGLPARRAMRADQPGAMAARTAAGQPAPGSGTAAGQPAVEA